MESIVLIPTIIIWTITPTFHCFISFYVLLNISIKDLTSTLTIKSIQCSFIFITKIFIEKPVFMYVFAQLTYFWNISSSVVFMPFTSVLNILFLWLSLEHHFLVNQIFLLINFYQNSFCDILFPSYLDNVFNFFVVLRFSNLHNYQSCVSITQ